MTNVDRLKLLLLHNCMLKAYQYRTVMIQQAMDDGFVFFDLRWLQLGKELAGPGGSAVVSSSMVG